MGYLNYTKDDVEQVAGDVAAAMLSVMDQVHQFVTFINDLPGGPQQSLSGLGFTSEEITVLTQAFGNAGLSKLLDVFDGNATVQSAVDFRSNVRAILGPYVWAKTTT